ncbi:hypothetical protein BA190_09265 [Labrys sp. WJW]|uniref:hypothetical protein n=1 Tax=Labrys sp. WJW TaxID=1737983 RepID=UPI00082F9959|nr:hypothetical protein [Labrys sp. WJW]OCC05094.1 hypothetical protein BA190_09265 [Labrys sp. WJW]
MGLISVRGWLIIVAVVVVVGFLGWIATALLEAGGQRELTRIEKQDRSAVDAAAKARNTRRACVDAGGVWDTSTGKCERR